MYLNSFPTHLMITHVERELLITLYMEFPWKTIDPQNDFDSWEITQINPKIFPLQGSKCLLIEPMIIDHELTSPSRLQFINRSNTYSNMSYILEVNTLNKIAFSLQTKKIFNNPTMLDKRSSPSNILDKDLFTMM